MKTIRIGMRRSILLFAFLLLVGCAGRPKAPVLGHDPVYRNSHEGFRFVAPEGWAQTASANFPSDAMDKERMLVRYEGRTGDSSAILEVSCINLPETTDPSSILDAPSHGVSRWKRDGTAQSIEIHGQPATRYAYRSGKTAKEVVLFRRGGRGYFFTSVYAADDLKSRDLIRQAVESVVWTR